MEVIINADKERLQWRDNLLTKYEERIRSLEYLLRLAVSYVPNNTGLKEGIKEALNEGRTKEGRKDRAQNSNRDVRQQGGTGGNSS